MLGALTRGRSETEQKAIVAVAAGTTLALVAMRQRAIRSAIASMLTVRVVFQERVVMRGIVDARAFVEESVFVARREGYWTRAPRASFFRDVL